MADLIQTNKKDEEITLNDDGSSISIEDRNDDSRFEIKTDATGGTKSAHNIEPANPPTLAGTDQFGLNAVGTNEQTQRIQDLESARLNTPQLQTDTNESMYNAYTNNQGSAAQSLQYNGGQSGSLGAGMIAGTIFAEIRNDQIKQEEDKKKSAAWLMLRKDWSPEFAKFVEEFEDFKEEFRHCDRKLDEQTKLAVDGLRELRGIIKESEEDLEIKNNELKDLKEDLRNAAAGTPEHEMAQALVELKEAEIRNTTAAMEMVKDQHQELSGALRKARDAQGQAQKHIDEIQAKIDNHEGSGDGAQADLEAQLAEARIALGKVNGTIATLGEKIETSKMAAALTKDTKVEATACYATAEATLTRAAAIDAATKVSEYMREAAKGGEITAEEAKQLITLSKEANINQDALLALTRQAADSGMMLAKDGTTRLTGDQAAEMLQAEWDRIEEDKTVVKVEIGDLSERRAALQQEIKALGERQAVQQSELKATTALLSKETGESAKLASDIKTLDAARAPYTSEFDYMSTHYTTDTLKGFSFGLIGGGKETIESAGADPKRYLRDSAGDPVYINPDTMALEKFERKMVDGKRISTGEMVQIPPEEASALRAKLVKEKLLYVNHVPDAVAQKAIGEHSEEHGQFESMSKSFFGMNKSDLDAQVQKEQAAQTAQLSDAQRRQTASQAKASELAATQATQQSSLNRTSNSLARAERELENLNREQKEIERRQAATQEKGANAVDTKTAATTSATTTTTTATDATKGGMSETLALGVPKYTQQEAAEMKSKLDNVTAITTEGVEKLKEEAARYGISADTVEDTLKANKVEIKANEYAQVEPAADSSPAALSPTRTVNFAAIGVTTQIQSIANFIMPRSENNILGGGYQSFADSMAFTKTNAPNAQDSPSFQPIQIANTIEATNSFDTALSRQDPAVAAADADRRRMEQEASLRQAQELVAARMGTSGVGMMGGGGGAQSA